MVLLIFSRVKNVLFDTIGDTIPLLISLNIDMSRTYAYLRAFVFKSLCDVPNHILNHNLFKMQPSSEFRDGAG